ncbi:MAG: PAS domain-containing protein [Bacillus subtilis]|nr:PAS domain-containing protein [Bacillus subtilis]
MNDGKIFEINEGFTLITGYHTNDVIGKTTFDLNLWNRDTDRKSIVDELSKGNEVRSLELQFRRKDGRILIGLLSSKLIIVNTDRCILTSVGDIIANWSRCDMICRCWRRMMS